MQRQTWACGKGMAPEAGPRHREWAVGLRVKPERAATRHRASAAASTLPLHCKYRVFLQATTSGLPHAAGASSRDVCPCAS